MKSTASLIEHLGNDDHDVSWPFRSLSFFFVITFPEFLYRKHNEGCVRESGGTQPTLQKISRDMFRDILVSTN